MTAEYTAAQAQVAGEISIYAKLTNSLGQMAAGRSAPKDTPKTLKASLDPYFSTIQGAPYQQLMSTNLPKATSRNAVDGTYDFLVAKCTPRVAVTVQQSIVPDSSRSYALIPQTNILYTDSLTLGVDANGFLTNGAPTSTSQITAIASAIANTVGLAAAPGVALPGAGANQVDFVHSLKITGSKVKPKAKPKPSCTVAPANDPATQIANLGACDPESKAKGHADDAATAALLAQQLLVDLPAPGGLPNLPGAMLPLTFYAALEDWDPAGKLKDGTIGTVRDGTTVALKGGTIVALKDGTNVELKGGTTLVLKAGPAETGVDKMPASASELRAAAREKVMKALTDSFNLTLSLTCAARGTDPDAPPPAAGIPENAPPLTDAAGETVKPGVYDGIVVSASRPCSLTATQKRLGVPGSPDVPTDVEIAQSYFLAQDSRYLTILPTQRGVLVARSVAYTFAGGQPTGVTDSRPSEALAIVSFPGQVVGSFFTGVTSSFTNSQAVLNGKTADLTAQVNYLTAKTNLIQAQQKASTPATTTTTPSN